MSSNSSLQHLEAHYKALGLPNDTPFSVVEEHVRTIRSIHAAKRRRIDRGGHAYETLPTVDNAFASIKEAEQQRRRRLPAAQPQPTHPLQRVQTSYESPTRVVKEPQSPYLKEPSIPESSKSFEKSDLSGRGLRANPEYVPENQTLDRTTAVPGFSIEHRTKNIFDAVEDRAVLIRK
jgi:hypothetical protein